MGAVQSPRDQIIFALAQTFFAYRIGRYKMIHNTANSSWFGVTYESDFSYDADAVTMLFDVESDPEERFNLMDVEQYRHIAEDMISNMNAKRGEIYQPKYAYNQNSATVDAYQAISEA